MGRFCIVGICGTCEEEEKCVRNFGWEKLKEESYLPDVEVDGRATFECMLKKLARGAWRALI